ncbi:hypothetical protein C8R44DRAFT_781272 [Mycena epipterygia]|nr:hypothetical protein C8R44DRAFT_781272 [Mycena epipterygia]
MGDLTPGSPDALAQWTLFLEEYAKGQARLPPPALKHSTHVVDSSVPSTRTPPSLEVPVYRPGEISPETARTIAEFYDQYGFLPPPRADEETVRLQTIQEYNLFRQAQTENFHRCSSLVNTFFHFAPVCTISLFHNDIQVLVSKAGEFPAQEGLLPETDSTLNENGQAAELHELAGDWRFSGNPLSAVDSHGVKGYVGVPFTLEVDPSNPHDAERVTVGVVAVMSNRPLPKLTDTQRKVLDDLSTMLSVQLRSTWEGWQRAKETRLRNAVSLFLEKGLVEPSQHAIMYAAATIPPPRVQGAPSGESPPTRAETLTSSLFANAAEQLQELLEADFAIIIDLTSFHATKMNDRRQRSHSWVFVGQESQARARLSKRILGSSSSEAYDGHEKIFNTPEAMTAIATFLDMHVVTGHSVFSGFGGFSGLEDLLSLTPSSPLSESGSKASRAKTVPHLALPFYSANRPNLLIVVASAAPFFSFKPADVTFVGNLGLVLVAHLAQNAIVEADAAKTAFVSQISHELRTPLHGLLGQLDLLHDSFTTGDLSMVPGLLDSAEFCGTALRDIVDDVLDFGKMALSSRDGAETTNTRARHALVDLVQLTLETSRSCWLRRLQWQSVSGSGSGSPPVPSPVDLVVEYQDRSMVKNWWISLDVSGFMRILNNLVTNSLKYTPAGLITITLTAGRGTDKNGNDTKQVTVRVEDTGLGIAPEFLARIFEPFRQADSFSPGAGLGLHICKSIVERMHGAISVESRLGRGSIFTVVFPIEDMELPPPDTPQIMQSKVVSADRTLPRSARPSPWSETPPSLTITSPSFTAHPIIPVNSGASTTQKAAEEEQHLKILVVDDNAISRKILVAMLKRMNATAYQAEDGINALEVFREVQPHVVWTDISMPRMDGVTAAKEMRKIERERQWAPAHIVAITGLGLSDEQIRREALLGPAALDGWLIKGQTDLKTLKESLVGIRLKLKLGLPETPSEPAIPPG